jgi:hypothetical protein
LEKCAIADRAERVSRASTGSQPSLSESFPRRRKPTGRGRNAHTSYQACCAKADQDC